MKKLLFLVTILAAFALTACGSSGGGSAGGALEDLAAYPETINLSVGDAEAIQVVLTPSDAADKDLLFATSDRSVAVVDESGKVSALGAGSCTITIASKAYSDVSCHVEVIVGSDSTVAAQDSPQTSDTTTYVVYVEETNADAVYPTYYLSESEVAAMDPEQLQFVINQIYAKNGYVFNKDEIQAYFQRMPWYVPISHDVSRLSISSLDQSNLNLLVRYRDSLSSRPSGLGWMWTRHVVDGELSASYVCNLSDYDIQLLINTIYAKNGYIFETDSLQYMFEGQPWYHGITHNAKALNFSSLDQKNLALLTSYRS